MAAPHDVYKGFWINWNGGRAAGATLTTQNGAYLVAFLAMLVRIAGNHFWRLLCYFVFHTFRKARVGEERPWRQQKAILRNSYSPMDAMLRFIAIGVRSHKRQQSSMLRPLSLAATALLNVIAFTIAAIFSSAVTRAESAVLLQPSVCGRWLDPSITTIREWDAPTITRSIELIAVVHQNLITSSRFHLACSDPQTGTNNCNPYSGRPLNVTTSETACPFDSGICLTDSAILLDTGRVNSLKHLGINSPKSASVDFRRTATCAPLVTSGHTLSGIRAATTIDDTNVVPNLTAYFYGKNKRVGSNFTYAFNQEAFQTSVGTGVDTATYQLDVEAAAFAISTADESIASSSTFIPLPELRKANAVSSLVFMAQQADYLSPVVDPWFKATTPFMRNVINSELHDAPLQMYRRSDPISVLGCFEQIELCNPQHKEDECMIVPLGHHILGATSKLQFSEKQKAIVQRLYDSLTRTALHESAFSLGGSGLLASAVTQGNLSPGLPDDQWRLEVQNWFNTSLTALQLFTAQYVTGFGRPELDKYITPPSEEDEWMCKKQIVQRNDFASFSVLGLSIIIVISGLIIVLSESLSRVIPRIPTKYEGKQKRDLEWHTYDILELQRADIAYPYRHASISLSLKPPFLSSVRRTKSADSSLQHDSPLSAVSTAGFSPSEKISTPTSADIKTPVSASSSDTIDFEKWDVEKQGG